MMKPYPLAFRPVLKQTIWGGRKLGQRLGKPIGQDDNYAESWEIVDHGTDQSIVANGSLAGIALDQLIRDHPQWLLGSSASQLSSGGESLSFPLLLKYLDCNRVLSVQVHPDDAYAKRMSPPDLGKTEAWYIVESDPGGLIYAGLKPEVDRMMLSEAIDAGQTEEVLHSFHPEPGDIVFIPAGTVHALGAGLLVAEIQQSSDTTFRLFDWNRVDAEGNARPLHIEQSLEVSDYSSGPVAAKRADMGAAGWQTMVDCDKFVLNVLIHGEGRIGGDDKFHIVTVPRGKATLHVGSETTTLSAGQSVLLPACMPASTITAVEMPSKDGDGQPSSTVLTAHLPN
ncbi:putative mannose-6-phosphate isomerase YvyI [Rubripirellula amarantea]|uniref:Putative mannose-6-phosphate isomerase YvyI n=2 Tax=Rubripirellula amarantea TaxID=2527999 RepID=A0A5C5WPP7_9BACT|nr:type I phosphomannose isomerase catalytic subunit [Rubripirellula amarantea]TWT52400.1 putative mannose-6-phosphate isomerase YvyI [Rubripirellula amarantea]